MSGDAPVAGILAGARDLILLAYGGESDVSGREREGFEEGPAQALVAAPAVDPAPVITIVEEQGRDRLPAESLAQLTEARDLLASAAGQSPEQAQPALEEAVGKLDGALSQVETAVNEAPTSSPRFGSSTCSRAGGHPERPSRARLIGRNASMTADPAARRESAECQERWSQSAWTNRPSRHLPSRGWGEAWLCAAERVHDPLHPDLLTAAAT